METMKTTCRVPSPLGEIMLVADGRGEALCGLYLEGQKYFPEGMPQRTEGIRLPLFRNAIAQLREYFASARTTFDLPLAPQGTAFQRDVWSAIAAVPFGATLTFGDLARRCARPSAVRAGGASTGRNPLSIVIPCHRIIGSGGGLTGYAGGLERKRALLALESRHATGATRKVA